MNNENLFDNWYFLNPVNQRGITSITETGYMVDRWTFTKNSSVSFTVTLNNGINVTTSNNGVCYFGQTLENPDIYLSKTYTASLLLSDNIVRSWTVQMPDSLTSNTVRVFKDDNNNMSLEVWCNTKGILFQFNNLSTFNSFTLTAAKLEEGLYQTLAHQNTNGKWIINETPNYGEQLLKCLRYLFVLKSNNSYYEISCGRTNGDKSGMYFPYSFLIPFRVVPTLVVNDISLVNIYNLNIDVHPNNLELYYYNTNYAGVCSVTLRADTSNIAPQISNEQPYLLNIKTGGLLIFSAEL